MGLDIFAASHLKYVGPVPRGRAFDRLGAECEARGKLLDDRYFLVYANAACHRARLRRAGSGWPTRWYFWPTPASRSGRRAGP